MYDTVLFDGRAHRALENGTVVQDRPMARSYRITDPDDLARKLEAGGFETRFEPTIVHRRRGAFAWSTWKHIVLAREIGKQEDGYQRALAFLCAHDGRTSFQVVPQAIRIMCENQFLHAPVRIRHTDSDIDEILRDPVPFARGLLDFATTVRRRLGLVRNVGNGEEILNLLSGRRRIHGAAVRAVARYSSGYRAPDFETALQALTETKYPTCVRLVGLALNEGFSDLVAGEVPQVCRAFLEEPAASLN